MKTEYDFSEGESGKFYDPNAVFSFPVYLESDVNDFLNKLADEKEVDVQELVNEWLRADIRVIKSISASEAGETA
jgi:hypothetical protein